MILSATASDRGSDKERISNVAGGNCKKNSMKITVKVVSKSKRFIHYRLLIYLYLYIDAQFHVMS